MGIKIKDMDSLDLQFLERMKMRKRFTNEEKELLTKYAAKYGKRVNTGCPDCWRDLVISLCAQGRKESAVVGGITPRGYQLKAGTDFILWAGGLHFHVCEKELSDENVSLWLRYGLHPSNFERMPDAESKEDVQKEIEESETQSDADNGENAIQ